MPVLLGRIGEGYFLFEYPSLLNAVSEISGRGVEHVVKLWYSYSRDLGGYFHLPDWQKQKIPHKKT